jgi:tetratricopeptide (TPR) repeat protein
VYVYAKKLLSRFRKRQINRPCRACAWAVVSVIALFFGRAALGASGGSFHAGNESYGKGDYEKAAVLYKQAIDEGASASLSYFNMGNCFYQMNRIPKAIGCYQAATYEAQGFFSAYLNLGILYQMQEDWPATIATLEIANTLEPGNKQVVLILAIAYRNLKAYAPAIKCIEQAMELDSTLIDCSFLLFDIYQELEDLSAALASLDRYPDAGKRAAEKYRLLAGIAEVRGETEKSAFLYRKEIECEPDNRGAYFSLVNALYKCGHGLLALETAGIALRKFDNYADLALLAGNIAFERKYTKEAGKFYQKAYSLGDARGLIGLQNVVKTNKRTVEN